MERVDVNPSVLKWAREINNLSLEKVASRLGKTPEEIKSWENGTKRPTYVQLERLAYNVYKKPIVIFLFPEVPEDTNLSAYFRTLPDEEYNKLNYKVVRLFGKAKAFQLNLKELYNGKNPCSKCVFKDFSLNPGADYDNFAKRIRNYFDVSIKDQINWNGVRNALKRWRNIFADHGVYVFKDAFEYDAISGFSVPDGEFPIIYVNNSMPKTRQVFTLFHELAHILFGIGGIDKNNDDYIDRLTNKDRKIEIFCNRFSGKFLVPDREFEKKINNFKIDDRMISNLARIYSVSREVILRKLLDFNKITEEYYDKKVEEWKEDVKDNKGNNNGGHYYYNKIAYLGEDYLDTVLNNYQKNKINIFQVSDYLDIKPKYISKLQSYFFG